MRSRLIDFLKQNKSFFLFILLMSVFRSAVADWNDVPTGSMKPTIVEGDRILVNKMAYDVRLPFTHVSLVKRADPARGDIIVFDSKASGKRLVKRVVGIPGDVVALQDNQLTLNGQELSYDHANFLPSATVLREDLLGIQYLVMTGNYCSPIAEFSPVRVPADHYLALGDNRDNSADSRVIGFIPRQEIVGRSRRVVLSLDYDNFYLPREGRYLLTL